MTDTTTALILGLSFLVAIVLFGVGFICGRWWEVERDLADQRASVARRIRAITPDLRGMAAEVNDLNRGSVAVSRPLGH